MEQSVNIKIPKSINFSGIEEIYKKFDANETLKLQLPNSLSHSGGFGIEGFVLQLYLTLMRQAKELIAHTFANSSDDSGDYEELCNHLLGLSYLRMSDVVLTSEKKNVSLLVALAPAIPIFKAIRSEDFKSSFKGRYVALPAIKSAGSSKSREFEMPLYNSDEVVGAEKFLKITKKSIEAIMPGSQKRGLLDRSEISNISEIIRELFTNTHRHARSDVKGNYYKKNVRAVSFRFDSLSRERMQEISKSGGTKLALFIGDWLPKGNKVFNALDITVVDSGPGFARRWSGLDVDELDFESEREAIISCFKKHQSSGLGASSGSGLNNVLKDLRSVRGWMRLRTGRALVEKSFFNKQGEPSLQKIDVKEMGSFVEGVVFNIVIPVDALLEVE